MPEFWVTIWALMFYFVVFEGTNLHANPTGDLLLQKVVRLLTGMQDTDDGLRRRKDAFELEQ